MGTYLRAKLADRRVQVAALGLATLAGIFGALRFFGAEAVPVLDPIYQIETVSNGHKGSLLNLRMGQPGVPQVPTPVDVDGDLLPDILVAVNVVDISGAVNNPPNPGAILAPNIEITRDPTAVARCLPLSATNACSPPLKVEVKLRVFDSANLKEAQVIRFGYDTGANGSVPECEVGPCPDNRGRIGSIPPYFKATLRGLESFFNPLSAEISTRGFGLLGQSTNNVDLNRVINGYEGPLDIVGSIGKAAGITTTNGDLLKTLSNLLNPQDDKATDLRLGYRPWPGAVKVTYGTDDKGNHITYEHERKDEVDLTTRLATFNRKAKTADASVFEARVDRLPRRISLDFLTGNRTGDVTYQANADGRLPDVHVGVLSEKLDILTKTEITSSVAIKARLDARLLGAKVKARAHLFIGLGEETSDVALVPKEAPLIVSADVEALPPVLAGRWSLPEDGPASALFCAGLVTDDKCSAAGQGIGAAEATIETFYTAEKLPGFVPEQQQFLNFQSVPGGTLGDEDRISARVDRIREVSFAESEDGFDATVRVGDGELPLQLHFGSDDRTATEGVLVDAIATISPLPDRIVMSLREPGDNEKTDPLKVIYESSKSVDVDSRVELREFDGGPSCGTAGTICGNLAVRHLPARIETRVGTFDASVPDIAPSSTTFPESRIEIDATPRPGGAQPDFFADVVLGQDDATLNNFADDIPLVARAELLGLPNFSRIRTREGLDETLDRLEFHACDRQFDQSPPTCKTGTDSRIGSLSFGLRNWLERPADLPILEPTTPLYATLAVRGVPTNTSTVFFEANGKVTDIAELQYRNTGSIFGLRSRVGGGKNLSALVDIANVDFEGDNGANGRVDILGEAKLTPLPATADFCLRQSGQPIRELSDSFTDPCENDNAFGDTAKPASSPLSVAYRAATSFNATANVTITQHGLDTGIADDHRLKATLDVTNLPKDLTAHVDAPATGQNGQIRAIYKAPTTGPQVNVDFSAELTDADLVCQDPRTPADGKEALCVKGKIAHLPTSALFLYDPTKSANNLLIDTTDPDAPVLPERMDVTDLEFSSVRGVTVDGKLKPSIVVATGQILDLPQKLTGRLDLPEKPDDAPSVDLVATPAVGQVDAFVRNFIAPDPILVTIPDRTTGFAPSTQQVYFLQRGDAFKAEAHIKNVRGAGYRTVKDATGKPLDTKAVRIDFGSPGDVIRAFADIQEDPSARTIADVTLNDIPAGLEMCFRGKKAATAAPGSGQATFCDTGDGTVAVGDGDGSFQLIGTPATPASSPLDVDAFIRQAAGGGGDIMAARVHITDIPFVLRGTFPADPATGKLEIAGFKKTPVNDPAGIASIEFNAASFDLLPSETGYGTPPVPLFPSSIKSTDPFPAKPDPGGQYLHAALAPQDFHARGRIGLPAGASSHLQRLLTSPRPCAAPPNNPPDYPRFPNDGGISEYTCLKAVFVSDPNDPLAIDLVKVDDKGDILRLRDAGITDIPDWFQTTLASTAQYVEPGRLWRRPCGRAADEPANADCMPPLIRLDQPLQSTRVFGVLETGKKADLDELNDVTPSAQLADLNALPAAGWSDWGADPTGVRLKVVSYGSETENNPADDRSAVRASLRLPIPQSLTVDQLQDFDQGKILKTLDANGEEVLLPSKKAKDVRLRYAIRNSNGAPVDSIGELTALIHDNDKGEQVLVSDRCQTPIDQLFAENSQALPATCPDFGRGLKIPGELGVQLYTRENVKDEVVDGENHRLNSKFFQIDGRTSSALNAGVRITGGEDIGVIYAAILKTPTGVAAGAGTNPLEPSFRLRAEIVKEKSLEPPGVFEFETLNENVKVRQLFAQIDFSPTATPARQIDAVIYLNKAKFGADVAGYTTVGGTTPAKVNLAGAVDIDPLSLELKSVLDLSRYFTDAGDWIRKILADCCGIVGTVVGEILGFVVEAIGHIIDAVLNSFPVRITLDTGMVAHFLVDAERFTLRNNIIHAKANAQGGTATVGPINLEMRDFYGGVNFYHEIDIPWPLDWIPGVPDAITIDVPLVGVKYLPGLLPDVDPLKDIIGFNSKLQFRDCSFLSSLVGGLPIPFTFENATTFSGAADMLIYPLTDPRYQLFGIVLAVVGPAAPLFDTFLDVIAGPIFCNAVDADKGYHGISYTNDAATYGPGNNAATADQTLGFPGHPVPGQVGSPLVVPDTPPAAIPPPPPPPAPPAPPTPPAPPGPPSPPPPVFTGPNAVVSSPISLCGTHELNSLTIDSAVTVATSTDTAAVPWGPAQRCPAGQGGKLRLLANNLVVNQTGSVVADGIATANPSFPPSAPAVTFATGNSGGGNGGAGGNGSTGTGGQAYGASQAAGGGTGEDASPVTAEATVFGGAPGSGSGASFGPGTGGGTIVLLGDAKVDVKGTVSANGTPGGGDGAFGACSSDTTQTPHTGRIGAGGGSGGGIVISGRTVDLTGGTVRARGGNGGAGKLGNGGAGGGGVIKVISPVPKGLTLDVAKGQPGTASTCSGVSGTTAAGDGITKVVELPRSQALAFDSFWYAGDPPETVDLWVAAAALDGDSKGLSIVTCAVTAATSVGPPDEGALLAPPPKFTMPTTQPTPSAPCGSGGVTPVKLSDHRRFEELLVSPDTDAKLPFTPPGTTQYLGIYTVALRSSINNNDCLNPSDASGANDATVCFVERLPVTPDRVIGVDAARPTIGITSPTANQLFTSHLISLQLNGDDQANLSRLDRRECSSRKPADPPVWVPCALNNPSFELKGGEGVNVIEARAFDKAGNVSNIASVSVRLDLSAPTATASFVGGTIGGGGWYTSPPTIQITGSDLGPAGLDPTHPFAYRFDEGEEHLCDPGATCTVDPTLVNALVPGEHVLHFTAIDAAGHRLFDDDDTSTEGPMQVKPIKLDGQKPTSVLLSVPGAADGENGWFTKQPFVVFSAVDQLGASGFEGSSTAGIFYTRNGTPQGRFDGVPFRLGPGEHDVCWFARDVAGNEEDHPPATHCRHFKVDDAAPAVDIVATPLNPDGTNGWYVTKPAVGVAGSDPTPGSGIDTATTPSGVFVSVDGRAYVPFGGPITIGEGLHRVRAFTVDVSGQRSPIREATYQVDLSNPVSAVRVIPPDPAKAEWWRRLPRVVLRATDGEANAGVDRIEYSVDGSGPTVYTGPFEIPAGVHTVTWRAFDRSGPARTEAVHSISLSVDVGAPIVKATTPQPVVWTPGALLQPAQAQLKWTVKDDLSDKVQAVVMVYNALGQPVRRIVEANPRTLTGGSGEFSTAWDGKDQTLLGLVPAGVYHYRVMVVDEAGNTAQSGESSPIQIKVGLTGGLL